ncbi:MAG: hypothetical protein EAZ77_15020 [Nostocales cyanobacterium]|nr:MAG: hypothetical protein EAZ77_15020 [Nostocales cyanobacterium]
MIKSQALIDLSSVEQQVFAGGQSNLMDLGKMPKILNNGFPNVTGVNPSASTETGKTQEETKAYNNNVGVILY